MKPSMSKLDYLKDRYMSSSEPRNRTSKKKQRTGEGLSVSVSSESIPNPVGVGGIQNISEMELLDGSGLEESAISGLAEDDIGVVVVANDQSNLSASERRWIRIDDQTRIPETPRSTRLDLRVGETIPLSRLQTYLSKKKRDEVEYVYGADTVADSIRSTARAAASAAMTPKIETRTPAGWETPLRAIPEEDEKKFEDNGSDDSDLELERPRRSLRSRRAAKRRLDSGDDDEEIARRYEVWSRGITQVRANEADKVKITDPGPLARSRDDPELDSYLKQQIRPGDPMMKALDKKEDVGGDTSDRKRCAHCSLPNRFGIQAGYRWDGVDRSNGFEQKYFGTKAKKVAVEEMAYKWRVEDM